MTVKERNREIHKERRRGRGGGLPSRKQCESESDKDHTVLLDTVALTKFLVQTNVSPLPTTLHIPSMSGAATKKQRDEKVTYCCKKNI